MVDSQGPSLFAQSEMQGPPALEPRGNFGIKLAGMREGMPSPIIDPLKAESRSDRNTFIGAESGPDRVLRLLKLEKLAIAPSFPNDSLRVFVY
jgi:hypothetical protein